MASVRSLQIECDDVMDAAAVDLYSKRLISYVLSLWKLFQCLQLLFDSNITLDYIQWRCYCSSHVDPRKFRSIDLL